MGNGPPQTGANPKYSHTKIAKGAKTLKAH